VNVILEKAIKRQPITDEDIRKDLAEICEAEGCGSSCPVYEVNGFQAPCKDKGTAMSKVCVCRRNGGLMLNFIREYYISIGLMRTSDMLLAGDLTEICERVHASCDKGCPVWVANGGKAPMRGTGVNHECVCFKDGTAMLKFLAKVEARNRAKEEACMGEELWKPEGNPKVTSSHRQRVADKQTEGWIKVIRGKRK
jgi:hypothetical protein